MNKQGIGDNMKPTVDYIVVLAVLCFATVLTLGITLNFGEGV